MITNSDQMKHTCHSKECSNSHINKQCLPLWRHRRRVFSHANCHKVIQCHPAIDFPTHLAPVIAIRRWFADSRERISFFFTMSHMCSVGERSVDLAAQGSCCTRRRASCVAAAYVDVRCPAENVHHLPVCRGRMLPKRWRSPGLRRTCTSITCIQTEPMKTTVYHFSRQSILSRHQSSRAWWWRGVL